MAATTIHVQPGTSQHSTAVARVLPPARRGDVGVISVGGVDVGLNVCEEYNLLKGVDFFERIVQQIVSSPLLPPSSSSSYFSSSSSSSFL